MPREYKVFTPAGFTGEPTTELEALVQARAVLDSEERWTTGSLYEIDFPREDPKTPYCDSWRVCAMGAVAVVTLGAAREFFGHYDDALADESDEDQWGDWDICEERVSARSQAAYQLYRKALKQLDSVLPVNEDTGKPYSETWEFNDGGADYTAVIQLFDKAIDRVQKLAEVS